MTFQVVLDFALTNILLSLLTGQDACDASEAADSSQCVWCEIASFGFCVSEDQAQAMKQTIPGLNCDDDDNDDDDAVANDDDAPSDDTVPDDYWKCLKGFDDQDSCTGGGCEWCANKAGFGVCLSKEAADKVDKYDWFDCTAGTNKEFLVGDLLDIKDPYDPSCLQASLEGDQAACEATADADGKACEWCSVAGANLCLSGEQAEIVQQFGGECSAEAVADPYGTSCLMASLSGDEGTCESTTDEEGNGCEWCSVNGVDLCLNAEQAEIAQQVGGECSKHVDNLFAVNDPYDASCLAATVDKASCEAATDSDGNSCEFCNVAGVNVCLNPEQAQAAQLVGGDCSASFNDPYDPNCLQASLEGDESSCKATVDAEGSACEWCSVASVNLCLNSEQAEAAELMGGTCSSTM